MLNKTDKSKELIKQALASTMIELRGSQSLFKFSSENDISISIISEAERGLKDPQLTTNFKLAEAYSIKPTTFISKILEKLPSDFSMIDK